jgi:hypothetical protein
MIAPISLVWVTLEFIPDTTDTADRAGAVSGLSWLSGVFPSVGHTKRSRWSVRAIIDQRK